MPKIIFYAREAQFEVTENEFKQALIAFDGGHKFYIPRLDVSLSPNYLWAGEKPLNRNQGYLHDGIPVVKKFGRWEIVDQPDIVIDPVFYPEVAKDEVLQTNPKAKKIIKT